MNKSELLQENKNLKEAMAAIRFLVFEHEVAYWNDAIGSDSEKRSSILKLAQEANWGLGRENVTAKIVEKHTFK